MSQDALNIIRELMSQFESERNHFLIVGRALTEEEQARVEELQRVLAAFSILTTFLENEVVPEDPVVDFPTASLGFEDGRYEGGTPEIFVDLRVDEDVSGIISADLFRHGAEGKTYVGSIRTLPGVPVLRDEERWDLIGADVDERECLGELTLHVHGDDPDILQASLYLDEPLKGIPSHKEVVFGLEFKSSQLRSLGLEIEREDGIDPLPTIDFEGEEVTFANCFQRAGFDVHDVGERSLIPKSNSKWGMTQLHALMVDFAESDLSREAWKLNILLLNRASREGLLGVMFDDNDNLPRQGAAVFSGEVKFWVPEKEIDREIMQTALHEAGHALNLVHRFERGVGRADSTSIMNYPQNYKGGGRTHEFWQNFDYSFDADELDFLRHAPLPALIPGGAAFHSMNYWADGNGGYVPYVPEVALGEFDLSLTTPPSGPVFQFAQPVFLAVSLLNRSEFTYDLTPDILDPKSGFLEVMIQRVDGASNASVFHPVAQRCFRTIPGRTLNLRSGDTIQNNLNLTFGSSGFPFAEPGAYDVTAVLAFYNRQNRTEWVVKSNTLRIRISYPHSVEEERTAMTLLRSDVGLYFALGGSSALDNAHDSLQALKEELQHGDKDSENPIVASITRCQGIDAGRSYTRYRDGSYVDVEGKREQAADLLGGLNQKAVEAAFDSVTIASTARLAEKHLAAVEKVRKNP